MAIVIKKVPPLTMMVSSTTFKKADAQVPEISQAGALREKMYQKMATFGSKGCTTDELEPLMEGVPQRSFTPRYAEMEILGMIISLKETRVGTKYKKQQTVRKVLPPPFIRQPTPPSKVALLREQVKVLTEKCERLEKALKG